MGLINWIFDFYQHSKVDRAQRDTDELRREVAQLRSTRGDLDSERLLRAVEELALAVKTIESVCVQKGLCTPQEFQQRLREIDAQDGRSDGRSPLGG